MHQVGLIRQAVIGSEDSNAGFSPESRFDAIRVFRTGTEGVRDAPSVLVRSP